MAIETLKEYLVKIGWNIDEISFKNADSVIDRVSGKLSKSASGIASSFIKAGTIVGEAIVEINEQMFSLIDKTASLDYQTERPAIAAPSTGLSSILTSFTNLPCFFSRNSWR